MDAWDHKVIASLLLSVLSFVLVMGIILVFLVLHWRYRRILSDLSESKAGPEKPEPASVNYRHLQRPNCWLAIKNRNLLSVQSALGLHNPRRCSWMEGLSRDGDRKVFVSPPVSGWILVIGSALPDPSDDVDLCFRFLMDLSRKLGHVQYFASHAVLDHHTWAQTENGRVLRAYAWAGRTLWNQGEPTPAESDLAMKCYDYEETAESPPFGFAEFISSNSDKLHLLAARWSIDPGEIDKRFIEQDWGIVGDPSRLF
jgi:hypothetical protein